VVSAKKSESKFFLRSKKKKKSARILKVDLHGRSKLSDFAVRCVFSSKILQELIEVTNTNIQTILKLNDKILPTWVQGYKTFVGHDLWMFAVSSPSMVSVLD
jgi:hypothetical protein